MALTAMADAKIAALEDVLRHLPTTANKDLDTLLPHRRAPADKAVDSSPQT